MSVPLEYIVLCGQVVGGMEWGFDIVYGFDGKRFDDRRKAIQHGLVERGSDDFNIGVLKGGQLISLDWMNEPVDTDPRVLADIAADIGLGVRP